MGKPAAVLEHFPEPIPSINIAFYFASEENRRKSVVVMSVIMY